MEPAGPLTLYLGGFLLSLIPSLRPSLRDGVVLPLLGVLLAALGVLWFLWSAASLGWGGFGLALLVALATLGVGAWVWMRVIVLLEDLHERRKFQRHRGALEGLLDRPEGAVSDPELRSVGVLSFERQGGRTWFAARVNEDNGRSPDLLTGFLHAPNGPPAVGDPIPRSTGRYHEGAKPFHVLRIEHLHGPWWLYTAEEVWDDLRRSRRRSG